MDVNAAYLICMIISGFKLERAIGMGDGVCELHFVKSKGE